MQGHKLFHLLVALVACAPTLGSSSRAEPTEAATATGAVSVGMPPTVTAPPSANTAAPSATLAPLPSSAPPSLTPPASTAAAATSPVTGAPQWGHQTKTSGCVVQGPFPDPACTPGDIFPNVPAAQVCVSGYSSSVRNVRTSERDAVYAEYGIPSHSTGQYDTDHFVSLELGVSNNDLSNLFPEAASPTPGFRQKDQVENYLPDQLCKGPMTRADAQRTIATN